MTLLKKQESIRDFNSIRKTTCCNCPAGCGLKVFLRDHSIVDIYGDEEHPINKGSVCPKGLLSALHLRNPKRVLHPHIRESLNDPFRMVTWDEALSFTAKKLQDLSEKRGKDSIFIYGGESAPFDYSAGASLFGTYFGTPNIPSRFAPRPFGHEGSIKKMFGVPGAQLLMNAPADWCNSRCILLYGCDLAASDPITFGPIIDARDRGTPLLVIDSQKTITASKATLSLRVKPGSESTALKGILHLLIHKALIEVEFLREAAIDFSSFRSKVKPFTPQRVAESCWVKEEDLEKMADVIARAKPVQVIAGDWATRHHLSEEDLLMCGALVCLRGSIGIPGGGLNFLNVSPFPLEGRFPSANNTLQPGEPSLSPLTLEEVLLNATKKVTALLWYGNPCARLAEGKRTKAALRDIPLIVHLSSYPNETYHYSHVSFPMSSWLEYSGLVAHNNGRALQWHHRVVDPPGQCKSPIDFWCDLAKCLNLERYFPWEGKNGLVDASKATDFFLQQNPLTMFASVEKLDPDKNPPGGLLWPCVQEADLEFENNRFIKGNIRGRNILFQRGHDYPLTGRRFPTPDGRISFACFDQTEGEDRTNEQRQSFQESVVDSRLPEEDSDFPLLLITGVPVDFIEEFGYFVNDRDKYTKRMILELHPQLGTILEIISGETIIVENERGNFSVPVWLNENVDPRVLWCPDGVDPYQPYFACESPYSLFEAPDRGRGARPFTKVTIYKPGGNKRKTREQLLNFLKRFASNS